MGEFLGVGGDKFEAIFVVTDRMAAFAPFGPEMLEPGRPVVAPGVAEGMEVFFAVAFPVLEFNSEFEGGLRFPHEIGLAYADQAVEQHQRRDGSLADSDRADGITFDQRQIDRIAHGVGDGCGSHPARGAAAGHDDAPGFEIASHRFSVLSRKVRMRLAVSAVSGASMPRAGSGICSVTSGGFSNT